MWFVLFCGLVFLWWVWFVVFVCGLCGFWVCWFGFGCILFGVFGCLVCIGCFVLRCWRSGAFTFFDITRWLVCWLIRFEFGGFDVLFWFGVWVVFLLGV